MSKNHGPLTPGEVYGLADVMRALMHNAKVRRYMPGGEIAEGTLRYLSGDNDSPRPDDVRDCYVRVTLVNGFETWWPITEIARQSQIGEFAIHNGVTYR
jgi:hypothetical protein